jgi:UDP-glucose 4-epimerase
MVQPLRILITGGTGLLGGRLADYFSTVGFFVRLGVRKGVKVRVFPRCSEISEIDWACDLSLRNACSTIDLVINAVGMNSEDCVLDPVAAITVNGIYNAKLLNAAVSSQVPFFWYISTARVYDGFCGSTLTVKTPTTSLHPYATSHMTGEVAVLWARHQEMIGGYVIRLSNAFGRPVDPLTNCWSLLLNDLCRQVIERGVIRLRGNGEDLRDFIPITVFCKTCHELVSGLSMSKPIIESGILNLGFEETHTTLEMAEIVRARAQILFGDANKIEIVKHNDWGLKKRKVEYRNTIPLTQDLKQDSIVREIDDMLQYCYENFNP